MRVVKGDNGDGSEISKGMKIVARIQTRILLIGWLEVDEIKMLMCSASLLIEMFATA